MTLVRVWSPRRAARANATNPGSAQLTAQDE